MTDKRWAYEDFEVGASIPLGSKLVTAAEIVEFASEFDAQPMHLDEEAGKASILGGLSASGWHSCAMLMRMICDAYLLDSTCQGAPGVDHMRWKKPVLAGDTLTGASTITAKRLSQSRPKLGFVTFRYELANQKGETVLEMQNTAMFLRRNPS
ncbi:MaoC family dehydratase [Mesorhizobium sp. LHD-90]|uniref:MaoC family dehydratase n=1 Tax=Mesorhizobium sp. LHD-90 TaxID=3071414 RepID=UPI0027DFF0FC|nr:MaoC family dehydratase [Mesorhizobium sp. LHD-90]MDQ6436735.1 MaoC family dehydratase [Mesorhizobium sp. LHD-90]